MQNENVIAMNEVIKHWKLAYTSRLSRMYPDKKIPANLATKNWSDILKTSYRITGNTDSTAIFLDIANLLREFSEIPSTSKFYHDAFGAITQVATQIAYQGIRIDPNVKKTEAYIILPKGTPFNSGLPVGIQNAAPNVDEIFAVSKNELAHQVDPLLFFCKDRSFVIKAVPELPNPMLKYAEMHNIKVR